MPIVTSPRRPVLERLELVSVRSHAKTNIRFSSGLNVIVGPTDSGKSNIIRAIEAVTDPDSASAMIRDGADSCAVVLRMTDQSVVEVRRKSSGGGRYLVRDRAGRVVVEAVNPGRSLPPRFIDAVGLGSSDLGGVSVNLHIQTQREAALLVDDGPGRVAKIIGAVSGAEVAFRAAAEARRLAAEALSAVDVQRGLADIAVAEAQRAESELVPRLRAAQAALGSAEPHVLAHADASRAVALADASLTVLGSAVTAMTTRARPARVVAAEAALASVAPLADQLASSQVDLGFVDRAVAGIRAAVAALQRAEVKRQRAESERQSVMEMLDVCPTCGTRVGQERLQHVLVGLCKHE